MDSSKRRELVDRIKILGLLSHDSPLPLVTLEEFFVGNDDYGSIGCNLNLPGPQFFYENLKLIRSKSNVQDVLVEITEVEEGDPTMWPFSDRIYVFTDAAADDVGRWMAALQPDTIEEGFANGKPERGPELKPGFKCYGVWWD
jgi:hypothetical protein